MWWWKCFFLFFNPFLFPLNFRELIHLTEPLTKKSPEFNVFLFKFLGALLNLVEGGGGDWWCEAVPPQGLLHDATLSHRSLLAFAQAGTGAADPPLISDGQHGNAGVRGVSGRYKLQPHVWSSILLNPIIFCSDHSILVSYHVGSHQASCVDRDFLPWDSHLWGSVGILGNPYISKKHWPIINCVHWLLIQFPLFILW